MLRYNDCIVYNELKSVCEVCFGKSTGHNSSCINNNCKCKLCITTEKLFVIEPEKEHSLDDAANSFEIMSLKISNERIRERNSNRLQMKLYHNK